MQIIESVTALATQDFADPAVRNRVCKQIMLDIARSLTNYPMRRLTKQETQRRFNICFEGYRVMRNELKWSTVRSIDHMYGLLARSLRGEQVTQIATRGNTWYGPSHT